MQLFQSLRFRTFALLWSGQTVSRLGDGLFNVAIVWWVLDKTGSATVVGLIEVFSAVPKLIFLLIGGVIADRLPRLRIMLTSDTARGLILASVAVLTITNRLAVWHLYVAAFIFGFVDAFFQPAYAAVVPETVPTETLPSANGLTALSGQLAGIFGPSIGGIIVAAGGSALAFGLDSVSFFVAAACVIPILGRIAVRVRADGSPHPGVVHELREGFDIIRRIPYLWVTITAAGFANLFFGGAMAVAVPSIVKLTLKGSAEAYGGALTALSIGAIIGSVLLGRAGKLRRRGLLTYLGFIAGGVFIALIGLSTQVWMVIVGTFGFGFCLITANLLWTNMLQELVPPEMLGRVSSVDQFGSFILMPIGYGMVGLVIGAIGAPLTLIICGLSSALLIASGLLHPRVRGLD